MTEPQKGRIIDDPLISVIVPVYKVEKYLDRCIQSIIAQTYKNFEVFLVDDGSPDNCGRICDEYAENNTYIHVIHQANAGQAAARNRAVQASHGEFVAFIDSDDFVEPDYLEYLLRLQQKYQSDMAVCGLAYLYEGKEREIGDRTNERDMRLDAEEALIRMNYNRGFGATACPKLIKRELVLAHPFPVGQIYEDLATLYKIVGDCSAVAYGSRRIYYWVQRTGSTMRSAFDERQMAGIKAAEEQIEYIKARFPRALPAAQARYEGKIVELMAIALKSSDSYANYKLLKSKSCYWKEVLADRNVKKTQKIRIRSIRIGYFPTRLVYAFHERMKRTLL